MTCKICGGGLISTARDEDLMEEEIMRLVERWNDESCEVLIRILLTTASAFRYEAAKRILENRGHRIK